MSASTVIFILYALTGEAMFTPLAQYDSKDSCETTAAVMGAVIVGQEIGNARFACLDAESIVDMLQANGVDLK